MADKEEKDVQAFTELQNRVLENSEKQKYTQQQLHASTQQLRRAVLTAQELEKLPDSVSCFEAVGKAYMLAPRTQLLSSLQEQATTGAAAVRRLEDSQKGLKSSMEGIEKEVRELLQSSPALARAFVGATQ